MAEQQAQLDKTLTDWMGEERQTDDIIVIGMQID
ncbi:MAG TPA: hypothetical protein DCR93_34145 [Cytophagales bacterium]|nr:hypothetical protein [Cytophagales bacterium]